MYAWMVFLGPSGDAEMRIAATNRALSVLLTDGDNRILILNARGPQDARSVLGTLSIPWESPPATIIISSDRGNLEALWEALQRLNPRQLIVAGAPGADPAWLAVERYCQEADVTVNYLEFSTEIALESTKLTVVPPNPDDSRSASSYVKIDFGSVTTAVALSGLPNRERFHMVVTDIAESRSTWADLRVAVGDGEISSAGRIIILRPGERINVKLEADQIRIQGRPARQSTVRP